MTYISLDAELKGIDGFGPFEIGDYLDNSQDCRVVSVGGWGDEASHHLAAEVDDDIGQYVYLVTVDLEGDVILDDLFEAVEDTDMEVVFDYLIDDYVIARQL